MTTLASLAAGDRRVFNKRRLVDTAIVLLAIATEIEVWTNDLDSQPTLSVLAVVTTFPLLLRRRFPLAAPVTPALVFGVASFFDADPLRDLAFPLLGALITNFMLGRNNEQLRALVGLAVNLASLEIFVANFGGGFGDVVFGMVLAGVPWAVGQALRGREAQAVELRRRAVELEQEREQRDRAARADERLRIARELHDVVAHSIGVMTIQAGAARLVLENDPAGALQPLELVAHTGRRTLAEMERLLGGLRPDDEAAPDARPSLANLTSLADQYRGAGLSVEIDVAGAPRVLGAGLDLAAYRIVQEALTNSLKYAGPATACVKLRYTSDGLDVEIADDGDGSGGGTGSGHGLVGMRERATIYGGDLEAGPRPGGGFAVRARLPLEQAAP